MYIEKYQNVADNCGYANFVKNILPISARFDILIEPNGAPRSAKQGAGAILQAVSTSTAFRGKEVMSDGISFDTVNFVSST